MAQAWKWTNQRAQHLRWALLALAAVGGLCAVAAPAVLQPAQFHAFADQRSWGALPHAGDVLSNAGFALMALWVAVALWRVPQPRLGRGTRGLVVLLCGGFVLVAAVSGYYHLAPTNATLLWDRLGMAVAFAGVLGLAVATRVDARWGWGVAVGVLAAGAHALVVWGTTGNVLPWALLQGGGVLAMAGMALLAHRPGALPLSVGAVIGWYVLAKLCELGDAELLQWTGGLLSGHSLKHGVSAAAAWPVVTALRRVASDAAPAQPAGTMHNKQPQAATI